MILVPFYELLASCYVQSARLPQTYPGFSDVLIPNERGNQFPFLTSNNSIIINVSLSQTSYSKNSYVHGSVTHPIAKERLVPFEIVAISLSLCLGNGKHEFLVGTQKECR